MPTGTPGRTHGLVSTYKTGRCRCDACTQAAREYYGHRPREDYLASLPVVEHGSETRYVKYRCRCDECVRAANAARNQRRKNPNVAVHGRYSGYANGCRCDECRAAHNVYGREYKRRRRAARAAQGPPADKREQP